MDDLLREELICNLTDLIGEVYLLELLLDHPPQAGYCTPQVSQSLHATLASYIRQHTREIAWMARALTGGRTTPPA